MNLIVLIFLARISLNPNGIKGRISPNGVMMIPFYCKGVPANAVFKYASPFKLENGLFCTEIVKGELESKYAYFVVDKG